MNNAKKPKLIFLLAGTALLLAGCGSVSQERAQQTVALYSAVQPKQSKAEVWAIVGQPKRIDSDGTAHWEVRNDETEMIAKLDVQFDADGRTRRIHLSRRGPVGTSQSVGPLPGLALENFPRMDADSRLSRN